MDYSKEYNQAVEQATEELRNSEYAQDTYGCGTSFITIKFKTNPKFYNWAKRQDLLKVDGYYGAILDPSNGLRLALPGGISIGTLAQEFYNQAFCRALDKLVNTGAFTHTRLD